MDKKLLLITGILVGVGFLLLITGQFKFILISPNIAPSTLLAGSELFNIPSGQELRLGCPTIFNDKTIDFCFLATSIQPQSNTGSAIITEPMAYTKAGANGPTPAGKNYGCIWDVKKQEFLLSRSGMPDVVALFAPSEQYTIKNVCDISTGITFKYVQYEATVLNSEKYVIPIDSEPTVSVANEPIPSVDGIVRALPIETTSFEQQPTTTTLSTPPPIPEPSIFQSSTTWIVLIILLVISIVIMFLLFKFL